MKDILDQSVGILAEGGVRVTFRGTLYPAAATGFSPAPFQETILIPLPKIPQVSFAGAEGVPFSELFRVRLNDNDRKNYSWPSGELSPGRHKITGWSLRSAVRAHRRT